jgi:hypothetical protein
MKKSIILLFLSCILFGSCQVVDRYFKGDIIAKINGNYLYKRDVVGLVPSNTSPEDSVKIINQYINSWATKKLLYMEAEKQLTKEDRNLDEDIDNFRSALLVFRYEKLFVEQRIDTVITNREIQEYYEKNIDSFVYPFSLVKARYTKIKIDSPNYQTVKKLFVSSSIEQIDELEKLCYNSSEQYVNFEDDWVPMTLISKLLEESSDFCESEVRVNSLVVVNSMGYSNIVYAYERIDKGVITPLEYNEKRIKQTIISKRKQDLIMDLERNLLQDAIVNNKLKLYE